MREPLTFGRQSVLFVATHLAERKIKSVREEHRIVAEAFFATGRPDQRAVDATLELLHMAIRPCDRQHRDEMRLALLGLARKGIAKLVDLQKLAVM